VDNNPLLMMLENIKGYQSQVRWTVFSCQLNIQILLVFLSKSGLLSCLSEEMRNRRSLFLLILEKQEQQKLQFNKVLNNKTSFR